MRYVSLFERPAQLSSAFNICEVENIPFIIFFDMCASVMRLFSFIYRLNLVYFYIFSNVMLELFIFHTYNPTAVHRQSRLLVMTFESIYKSFMLDDIRLQIERNNK